MLPLLKIYFDVSTNQSNECRIFIPWAHMAAPTLLDTEKINPTNGIISKSAAVKPNTGRDFNVS